MALISSTYWASCLR